MYRNTIAVRALAFALLVFAIHSLQVRNAPNVTAECGVISSNTTWALAGSPYDVCASGVFVSSGFTLTIDPGVTVTFEAGAGNTFTVAGTLNAVGTAAQPITLTGVVTTPGSWQGISASGSVAVPAVVNLDFVTLAYGGNNGSFGAQVYADRATVTINHSTISNGAGNGLYTTNNTAFTVNNTAFTGNGHDAIQIYSPTIDLTMTGLSASGNGTNGVHIIGNWTLSGQRRWANPGIPYIVDAALSNNSGDILTIDPGIQLYFTSTGYFSIAGKLLVQGTATEPILMTGMPAAPGAWRGIQSFGGINKATVQLDYTTIEDGGSDINGANIELQFSQLVVHHSIIRNSSKDGVKIDNNATASILNSQIYGNGLYGIRNGTPAQAVLATENWWGDPGGPRSDIAGCSSGLGDKVTAGVLFGPVLTSSSATAKVPLSAAPNLTMTPRRWFDPADGVTRVWFDITLRDGNGTPLPGRTVRLHTTLGTAVDGGITDAYGHTLAYLTSTTTGDATVNATLDPLTSCEGSLSPDAKITFTAPVTDTDLMPNSLSPYFSKDIAIQPMPVVTGILETIYATLTNPLATPVTVDVDFAFVQSGIGLAFGPIKTITGQVIPANTTITLTATFTPVVSGHYCVQVSYTITAIGAPSPALPQAGQQLKQFNFNAQQSTTSGSGKNNSLDKTRNSLKQVNRFVSGAYSPNPVGLPLAVANKGIEWDLNNAEKISNALNGDPPRQDYMIIDVPHPMGLPPVQPGNGISAARAAAVNAVDNDLVQANAYGTAAAAAFDRTGGATEAGNLEWASTQTGVMLQYNSQMGAALITAANDIDNLIAVAASEGTISVIITPSDVVAMQAAIASGFSAQEIADAHTIGLTDADIETIRQSILAAKPEDLAGDVIANMQAIGAQFRDLGAVLENPVVFDPTFTVSGAAPQPVQPLATTNTMAQVFNTTTTIQLANPLATTSTITLSARRIDLPADWTVDVSPAQVTLAPGQQVTVTVTINAGTPVPQGSQPTVAVEGYVGTQLIGGVVVNITVPAYRPFDGKLRVYVPSVSR